jgi:hypothetical protein
MHASPKSLSVFALILAISLASTAQAQQEFAPVILKKVSNDDGLTLGNGVSLDKISPAYSSPFKDLKVSRGPEPSPAANIRMHLVTSAKGLDSETGVNVQARARYLFASAEAELEVNRTSSISEDSFRLVIIGESQYGHDELREPKLRPEAAALLQDGKMEEFSKRYGTHFVLREHRIARIVLTASVERWSDSTLQKLRAKLVGGVSLALVGGELKASIQNDLKEAGNRKTLNVEVSTIGGTGLQGFGDVAKALLSNTSDFQASVGDAVAALLKGFTRENSGIGSVTVSSYREYGWDAKNINLWNDLFENKLQKCADRYYAGRQLQRDIQAAIRINPPLKKKLEEYAGKYDGYLTELADFQKALKDMNKDYVAKELPKEPEIDPETAKVLFARFHTLESRMNELSDKLANLDKFLAFEPRGVIVKAPLIVKGPFDCRGLVIRDAKDGAIIALGEENSEGIITMYWTNGTRQIWLRKDGTWARDSLITKP